MLITPNLYTIHRGQVGSPGPSPEIWHDVLNRVMSPDGCSGGRVQLFDSNDLGAIPTVSGSAFDDVSGQVGVYADIGASLLPSATVPGQIDAVTGATDNNQVLVVGGRNVGATVKMGDGSIAFETRVKLSSLADCAVVAGLISPDVGSNEAILTSEELADTDFVGFHFRANDATPLQACHRANGEAATYVDISKALVADTWVKLGLKVYQRNLNNQNKVEFFVDNVSVGGLTTTVFNGTLFPSAAALAPIVGIRTVAAATKTLSLSFMGCAQDPVNHG